MLISLMHKSGWALVALTAGLMTAQAAPSFDCAKASGDAEKAICASAEISAADRKLAETYAELLKKLDNEAAAALRNDQRQFIADRDELFTLTTQTQERLTERLEFTLTNREKILNAVEPTPPAGLQGTWRNNNALLTISADKAGKLSFDGNGTEQVTGYWTCNAEGVVEPDGEAKGKVAVDNGWTIELTRAGSVLKLTENGPSGTVPYCGLNGAMAGTYFYVGAAH